MHLPGSFVGRAVRFSATALSGLGAPSGCEVNFGFFILNEACIMSFPLPTSSPFPSAPTATYLLGRFNDGIGSSGIVVGNVSTTTGASQIYLSYLEDGDATQLSQSGLN